MTKEQRNEGGKYGGNNTARVYYTAYCSASVHVSSKTRTTNSVPITVHCLVSTDGIPTVQLVVSRNGK